MVDVSVHEFTWMLQVTHLQCFILNCENLNTNSTAFYKEFWIFIYNFNISCRSRICRHEPCQMIENGCLVYLNSNGGVYKQYKYLLSPIFLLTMSKDWAKI
jgi:hypothetical protein